MKTLTKNILTILLSMTLTQFFSCEKIDTDRVTMIKTNGVSHVSLTRATASGVIVDLSDETHTDYGFCYATHNNPTIADTKTSLGTDVQRGDFSAQITDLQDNATYYLRAYTTNSNGTKYGNEISFSILELPTIPEGFILVEGGTFTMGCTSEQSDCYSDETPTHTVTVGSFFISKYEVTNAQYCEFLNEEGNQYEGGETWLDINDSDCRIEKQGGVFVPQSGYDNYPVIEVSWYGAKAYCEWAGGRLPTEAEWEFAARGGNQSNGYVYSGSNDIDEVAWYSGNSNSEIHAVGQKQPNELGIYDMSGNVWEWCNDWYDSDYYSVSPENDPQGPSSGTYRVHRGGSWNVNAAYCRSADRFYWNPGLSFFYLGFRLVVVP